MTLFPAQAPSFEALHERILSEIRDSPRKRRGLEWGESVADQILRWRADDGWNKPVPPPDEELVPGVWRPTPPPEDPDERAPYLLPHWGLVTAFAIPSGDFFRPKGPPDLESAEYTAEYNEVKEYGAAVGSSRSEEQTEIALFWADGAGTATPPGHWNLIAQDVATSRRNMNTMPQNARLFALLNVAMADAAICAWDAKYAYNFWQPVTAIRGATTMGIQRRTVIPRGVHSSRLRHFQTISQDIVHSAAQRPRSCRSSVERHELRSLPGRNRPSCLMVLFGTFAAFWKRRMRRRSAACTVESTLGRPTKMD